MSSSITFSSALDIMGVILTLAGGGGRPPEFPPPEYRTAVSRPLRLFCVSRWAGGRPPEGRPPAQRETPFPRGSRLRMEPAEWEGATGAVAPVANSSVC
ncbi:hypothetical protein NDU88_005315 [Pleurodeles waltl]|uniref:Uncharacterized protein n=1 Tax=Pleurodeles waltl TaxID=8319 RepID=A0AAV7SLI9_PLEWA|nr:hypothetical protein NDU88_005315 [Pleurodeles waltl]